jgi:hypothetical protein
MRMVTFGVLWICLAQLAFQNLSFVKKTSSTPLPISISPPFATRDSTPYDSPCGCHLNTSTRFSILVSSYVYFNLGNDGLAVFNPLLTSTPVLQATQFPGASHSTRTSTFSNTPLQILNPVESCLSSKLSLCGL